ncbi:hypothetical protein U5N28_05820 [Lysinibacillus telephonicus]|uniref:GIY-YIG domain-containing protein n=1 Tax=Lysinibacillus telephonicus TaxID=1714840 RepID=A0A3S0JSD1_9BACI|nr:hypothetical protein [Lysinibacillus telephonicus]RTQ96044.1 hypothetical protein EKG35_01365 [Lysinibacillus telephonicus]
MYVKIGDREFSFYRVDLDILKTGIQDIFSHFDKKTIRELLLQPRYKNIKDIFESNYKQFLDYPAGEVLFTLKKNKDPVYKLFLNNYGDLVYSQFVVKGNESLLNKSGLYMITVDEELVFAGVCANSFKLRFNQHIGNISPKCCYKDGTATHCHVNAKITESLPKGKVYFKICPMKNMDETKKVKNAIINRFEPIWNLRFGREELYS